MNWMELVQTILLIVLVDRSLILRSRYKIGVSAHREWSTKKIDSLGLFIFEKKAQEEHYARKNPILSWDKWDIDQTEWVFFGIKFKTK